MRRRDFFQLTGLGLASMKFLGGCAPPLGATGADNEVSFSVEGDWRIIRTNGVPDHPTGDFPNRHCPSPIRAQSKPLRVRARPEESDAFTPIGFTVFGVAINGVAFDPAGPHYQGDDSNGWQFDPSGPNVAPYLGIDFEVAHTQPNGAYHYHGIAPDLVEPRVAPDRMTLLGWAADGFPIYWHRAPRIATDLTTAFVDLHSSYRLLSGPRPDDAPPGSFDGTFIQDYEYVAGLGDLDEANGRFGVTPEFPDGIYYYVLTEAWPYIPRFHRGVADGSFKHPGTPGLKGLPPELRSYGA
jgi:hypothetical protein